MAQILEFLFGSKTKARLLRFFLMNPDQEFRTADISEKNMLKLSQTRNALNELKRNRFALERKKGGKKFYILNQKFPFLVELKGLFIKSNI